MPAAPVTPAELILPTPADQDNEDTTHGLSSSQFLYEFHQQTESIPLDGSSFMQQSQDLSLLEEYAYPVPSQSTKSFPTLTPPNMTSSPDQSVHPPASHGFTTNSCLPSSSCHSSHTNSSIEIDFSSKSSACLFHHADNSPEVNSSPQSSSCHSPEAVSSPQSSSPQLSPRLIQCPSLTPLPAVQNTSFSPKRTLADLASPRLPTPHIPSSYLETPQHSPLLPSSIN